MTGGDLRRRREALGLTQAQLAEHVPLGGMVSSRVIAVGEAERAAVARPGSRIARYAAAVDTALTTLECDGSEELPPEPVATIALRGADLRARRLALGISQGRLAERIGAVLGATRSSRQSAVSVSERASKSPAVGTPRADAMVAIDRTLTELEAERAAGKPISIPDLPSSASRAQRWAQRRAAGAELRAKREAVGLTRRDLALRIAEIIGCAVSTAATRIQEIEGGQRGLSERYGAAIASALAEGPAARDAAQPADPTPAVVAAPSPEPETALPEVPAEWRHLAEATQAGIIIGRLIEIGLARGGAR